MTDRPTNQQTDMRGHREVALLTTLTELLYLFISIKVQLVSTARPSFPETGTALINPLLVLSGEFSTQPVRMVNSSINSTTFLFLRL